MKKLVPLLMILVLILTACAKKPAPVQEVFSDGSYLSGVTGILSPEERCSIVIRQEDVSGSTAELPLRNLEDPKTLPVDSPEEFYENMPIFPALRQREDGSWVLVTLNKHGQTVSRNRRASKVVSYYSADGILQWTVTLTASFRYDNLTSVCTDSDVSVTVADKDSWEVLNWAATEDGGCTVTFRRTTLGVPTSTPIFTFQLTCDPDGNVT